MNTAIIDGRTYVGSWSQGPRLVHTVQDVPEPSIDDAVDLLMADNLTIDQEWQLARAIHLYGEEAILAAG